MNKFGQCRSKLWPKKDALFIYHSLDITTYVYLLLLLWLHGRGHPLVSIACLTITLCHSARFVAFHLSVCRSSLHQSVISSVHSRHGLHFRALPTITPNTMAFNIRVSFIRRMWPKNWSFLCIINFLNQCFFVCMVLFLRWSFTVWVQSK